MKALAVQIEQAVKDGQPVQALASITQLRGALEALQGLLVDEARGMNHKDVEIARALEVTSGAIGARYGTRTATLNRLREQVRQLEAQLAEGQS